MIDEHREYTSDTPTIESGDEKPATLAAHPFRLLLVVTTTETSKAFEFGERASLTVGRNAPADILLDDPSLSRLHACFRCDAGTVRVVDLGSRNGTWVDGRRIEEATLNVGSTAVLGSVSIAVQVATSSEAAMLGLVSSASMLQRVDEECARSRRFHRPLSLLIVRPLNNGALDARVVRQQCLPALRPIDHAGLYDRDALIVLLPETNAEAAAQIAQRMLTTSATQTLQTSQTSQTSHTSHTSLAPLAPLVCGLSSLPDSGFTSEQLVSAAWQALRETSASQPLAIAARVPQVGSSLSEATFRGSHEMIELQRVIERVAPHRISVLLLGETGTGKEMIARELHERGPRPEAPLRVVNCAAIPDNLLESVLFGQVAGALAGSDRDQPGVFVQADGGTIFLDEVGELSADAQAALLRVLDVQRICPVGSCEEVQVDVRVIAATHRDLAVMTEDGSFRLDLYHRLNSVVLRIPPLRERRDEIAALAGHFLERAGMGPQQDDASHASDQGKSRISAHALELLRAYHWPGNVRELRNVIERAVALCDGKRIETRDLPSHITTRSAQPSGPEAGSVAPSGAANDERTELDLRANLQEHEAKLIAEALRRSRGNQRRAAGFLRLPLRTFERKLKTLGDRVQRTS